MSRESSQGVPYPNRRLTAEIRHFGPETGWRSALGELPNNLSLFQCVVEKTFALAGKAFVTCCGKLRYRGAMPIVMVVGQSPKCVIGELSLDSRLRRIRIEIPPHHTCNGIHYAEPSDAGETNHKDLEGYSRLVRRSEKCCSQEGDYKKSGGCRPSDQNSLGQAVFSGRLRVRRR